MPPGKAFTFFEDPGNLSAITPPWLRFRMVDLCRVSVWQGAEFDYTIRWFLLSFPWRSRILRYRPPLEFIDYQLRGPYALWVHRHEFREDGGKTVMTDQVDLVLSSLSMLFWPLIRRQLAAIFRYRGSRIREWCAEQGGAGAGPDVTAG
jgi:hypothetical protein